MRNARGTTTKPISTSQRAKSEASKHNLHARLNTLHMQWPNGLSYLTHPAKEPGPDAGPGPKEAIMAQKVERIKAQTQVKFHAHFMPRVVAPPAMLAGTSTVDTAGATGMTKPSLNPSTS